MSGATFWIAWAQGLYFVITGVWPLVSLRTFMAVTGPKVDEWLVHTVGVLVTVIGGALCLGAARGQINLEVIVLAIGSAAALAGIDAFYVARGRIARIYLLDAAAEAVLIAGWAFVLTRGGWD